MGEPLPPPVTTLNPTASRRGVPFWLLIVVLAIAGGLAALVVTTRADLKEATRERDALQAAEDAREAEAAALPDVYDIVYEHVGRLGGYSVTGDESFASVSIEGAGLFDITALEDALVELGFSHSVGARIGNTRALDGTLSAESDRASMTWTYHPDDGLSIVIERMD